MPNAFSMIFFGTLTFSFFLRILSPQNVKNIVTGLPMAAAPFAIMKDAMALSRSPLNTIIVFPSLGSAAGAWLKAASAAF